MQVLRKDVYRWVSLCGVALLIGTTFAVQSKIWADRKAVPMTWWDVFLENIPFWLVWVVLCPLILRVARKIPFDPNRKRLLLLHIPAGVVFSIFHLILYLGFLWIMQEKEMKEVESVQGLLKMIPMLNLGMRLWSYAIFAAAGYVIDYYGRYQQGLMRATQLEAGLAQAQLEALKMQLQPHFLFNTLHSISALLQKDPEAADQMIARLGDFLRLTLDNSGTQEVTFEEELEFLQCYLEIEKIRFQDRLSVEFDIDSAAKTLRIPNLILQPIVENAIRHGIGAQNEPGYIKVEARAKGDDLWVQVRDNGRGLQTTKLQEGVGLSNVRTRLKQLYGASYQLELENGNTRGAVVTLTVPQPRPREVWQ